MAAPATDRSARLAELLARTALSDQAAYGELYRLTASHLYAVALRILREPAAAEDVLQEAFVSVCHHAGSYSTPTAKPQTCLTTTAPNPAPDPLRRPDPQP